ncbi:MAG: ATP-grasp domain-containing protein [Lachnospiraceae bacterium]|nr:ATP-grasp domain-containing protein [Lachnospiraceae bacterium]
MGRTGYLLYERNVAEFRKEYIDLYRNHFRNLGIKIELVLLDEYQEALKREIPDFVIVRAIAPSVSEELEKRGILVFNSASISKICNDKAKTYQYIREHTLLPFMQVYEDLSKVEQLPFPLIIKSKAGHGGTEVYYVNSEEQFRACMDGKDKREWIGQEPSSDMGKDVRVFVVGNRMITAMLRVSTKDFRSNYCLGGKVYPYSLSREEQKMIEELIDQFEFGMVGIDFIFHNGKMVFNEIEDVVGARMLYQHTDIDIVKEYANFIAERIE